VQLTEYGRTLLPQSLAIRREANEACSTLESLRPGVPGRFPDAEVRLTEETTPKLEGLPQAGDPDLAGWGCGEQSGDGGRICSPVRQMWGYIRVRRHVRGAAQIAFVKWLRE
jgi:hypothetical protein